MKDLIIEQIRKAKDEAVSWANHEIKAIVVKYQGRKDKKQLLEAELLKAKEFQDSAVGNGYINSLAPGFATDEELIQTIANYYLSSKVVISPNPRTGWTEESTMQYVYDDSLIFLRRYYLADYLKKMLFPPISKTLLMLFKDEKEVRKFLSHLNPNSDAADVIFWFRAFSKYDRPTQVNVKYSELYNALSPNYYGQGQRTLKDLFEGTKTNKKLKDLLEQLPQKKK